MPIPAEQSIAREATDEEIDAIIAECGGDAREAIRALLHDLTQLALDAEASVSRGYMRGGGFRSGSNRNPPMMVRDLCV